MGSSSWTGSGVVHYTATANSSSVITDDWGSSTEGLTLNGSSIICLRPKNANDPGCTMYTPHIQVYDAALTTSSAGRRDIELFWVPSRKLYTALMNVNSYAQSQDLTLRDAYTKLTWEQKPPVNIIYGTAPGFIGTEKTTYTIKNNTVKADTEHSYFWGIDEDYLHDGDPTDPKVRYLLSGINSETVDLKSSTNRPSYRTMSLARLRLKVINGTGHGYNITGIDYSTVSDRVSGISIIPYPITEVDNFS